MGARARRLSWAMWVAVPATVAIVAYRHRQDLVRAGDLLVRAHPLLLVGAVGAIALLYACRGAVYGIPLRLLGFRPSRIFLWSAALGATTVHQLIPTAGASGYAFLTWAMLQRGVPAGRASLVAIIDTLSYAAAVGTLVVATLGYLFVGGRLGGAHFGGLVAMGVPIVTLAAWLYLLQRDRQRLTVRVLQLKDALARLLGRRWPDDLVTDVLEDYYRGQAVIGRQPLAFVKMIALQYVAVGCDATALYIAFRALDLAPPFWMVIMGFVVAMSGVAFLGVPGGGGGFELIMSAFFTSHGLTPADSIAATLLYRVAAFWAPVVATLVLLLRLRRRHKQIGGGTTRPPKTGARPARARP